MRTMTSIREADNFKRLYRLRTLLSPAFGSSRKKDLHGALLRLMAA